MAFRQLKRAIGKYPLISNMVVCGGLYYTGDISRQTLQRVPEYETGNATRMAVFGTFIAAPVMYKWYQILDRRLPGTAIRTVIKKAIIDQCIIGGTLAIVFYVSMSFMEGKADILAEAKEKAPKTFLVGCSFWPFVQVINFTFMPPHMRTVYVSCCSFVWTNILSLLKSGDAE